MIKGEINSENNYRATLLDSSSSLKVFAEDRKKYLKQFILNEHINERDDQAITIGKLVETLLFEPEKFDDKFSLSACATPPTAMMLDFVNYLADITIENTDEFGQLKKSFEDMAQEAYDKAGYKLSLATVLNKFNGSDAEIYYRELLEIKAKNLLVVNLSDVQNAENIVEELRTNSFTRDIVNLISSTRYDVRVQFQIEDYVVDEHHFKSMIDLFIADFQEKTISVYDLKCTWSTEYFYTEYYLKRKSYLQAYLYYKACVSLTMDEESEFYGFTVNPPKFIVADSINYYSPLIYTLDMDDLNDAYTGFTYRGRKYVGVHDLIVDLQWCQEYNIWNISRENYMNKGVVKIKDRLNFDILLD